MMTNATGNINRQILCVICHQPILISNFGQGRVILEQNYVGCPNGHLVHRKCLKHWIVNSKSCPVCHEPYDMQIIQVFQDYLDQVERDRQLAEERKRKAEEASLRNNSTVHGIDPDFDAKIKEAEQLAINGLFEQAMNKYWDILDEGKFKQKDWRYKKVLLHLGLVYYRMEKYALALRQLMKLVKIDFNYPLAFYYLALCYQETEMWDKVKWALERAEVNLKKMVEEEPEYKIYLDDVRTRLENLKNII